MESFRVKVLYDFDAEANTGELSVKEGEYLTVTRKDVGAGWWEGTNQFGETGLFPAAYVEEETSTASVDPLPPANPPPPLPPEYNDDWKTTEQAPTTNWQPNTNKNWGQTQSFDAANDDWDEEDWDDGDSTSNEVGPPLAGQGNFGLSHPNREKNYDDQTSLSKFDSRGTVKKSINRFSTFAKSGGEAYIFGSTEVCVGEDQIVKIITVDDEVMWEPDTHPYSCIIASPKKESKLRGFKSFIAYQITPTFSNIQVSRRYKHFDWLHDRLEEKFTMIPIPPLPDKQVTGRYEEHFIEHRMSMLQSWVDRICRHPVLSRSSAWKHFLACTDEKQWKVGKRKAEKDELVGARYLFAIQAPETPLGTLKIEAKTENFRKFVDNMDHGVKNMYNTAFDQIKKYQGPYQRDFHRVGMSFKTLGIAFDDGSSPFGHEIEGALKHTGETYEDIARMFEDQPRMDFEPLCDVLHEYRGMLGAWPDILAVNKGSLMKRKECDRSVSEGKMDTTQLSQVCRRTDVVAYTTLAEITHFRNEMIRDYKVMMQNYLEQQINFFSQIKSKLETSLAKYDSI